MNLSKSRRGSRFWKIWAESGAVDYKLMAQKLGLRIFGYDPLIGCPFDDSEMMMVEHVTVYMVGGRVSFRGPYHIGTMIFPTIRGRIIAIGENAKFWNGDSFTALAVQVGSDIYFKHGTDVKVD